MSSLEAGAWGEVFGLDPWGQISPPPPLLLQGHHHHPPPHSILTLESLWTPPFLVPHPLIFLSCSFGASGLRMEPLLPP